MSVLNPSPPRRAGFRPSLLAMLVLPALPAHARGQAASAPEEPVPLVTLALWAEDVWLALTDRDGSYFGRLAEEGTFQRFNPLMDNEYELDIRTGLFSESEDARWAVVRRGFRAAGASINHPFILNFADWREQVPIGGPVDLLVRYRRQKSLTTQRDYPSVGLQWRGALGTSWTATGRIGMHFFKSSADVELGLARSWQRGPRRRVDFEYRVALLDAFTDVIFGALGVEPEETPAHFNYRRLPLAARLAFAVSVPAARLELHGGATTRSLVNVTFPALGLPPYTLEERVSFAGLLLELTGARRAAAVWATTARAATDRRHETPSDQDFRLRERTHAVGARATVALGARTGQRLDLELGAGAVWKPEDRTLGQAQTTLRHRDRELFASVALAREPARGWRWRLGYAFADRDAGVLVPQLSATHHRQLMEGGHRFRSGFEVMAGVRWDLDQGLANPFDGGHLRFSAVW
jgi:hypothetical protein